jgi:hypothetical protein
VYPNVITSACNYVCVSLSLVVTVSITVNRSFLTGDTRAYGDRKLWLRSLRIEQILRFYFVDALLYLLTVYLTTLFSN